MISDRENKLDAMPQHCIGHDVPSLSIHPLCIIGLLKVSRPRRECGFADSRFPSGIRPWLLIDSHEKRAVS